MTKFNWDRVRKESGWDSDAAPSGSRDVRGDREWNRLSELSIEMRYGKKADGSSVTPKPAIPSATAQYKKVKKPQPTARELTKEADKIMGKGQFRRACLRYAAALKVDPAFADAHRGQGAAFNRLGEYLQAESACRLAIKYDKSCAGAYRSLGHALMAQLRWDDAAGAFVRLLSFDSRNITALLELGNAYRCGGECGKAAAILAKAIHLDSRCATAHRDRGLCLLALGDVKAAKRHLAKLQAINRGASTRLSDAIAAFCPEETLR